MSERRRLEFLMLTSVLRPLTSAERSEMVSLIGLASEEPPRD